MPLITSPHPEQNSETIELKVLHLLIKSLTLLMHGVSIDEDKVGPIPTIYVWVNTLVYMCLFHFIVLHR